jgi:hypothetical protein
MVFAVSCTAMAWSTMSRERASRRSWCDWLNAGAADTALLKVFIVRSLAKIRCGIRLAPCSIGTTRMKSMAGFH